MNRLGIGLLCFVGCAAFAAEPLGPTVLGDTPWTPETGAQGKVIYGADDRVDVYTVSDATRLDQAAATCALIDLGRMVDNGNGTFTILTSAYTISGFPGCTGEAFRTQPVAAFCSGFLVADDVIATAGHCVDISDFSSCAYVFDWVMDDATTPRTIVNADQVYFGIELVAHAFTAADEDFALVRLDRAVSIAAPLEVRSTGSIADSDPVGVIGHPTGLPKKIAFGGATTVTDSSPPKHFIANLDTYGGNSGSPVFNQLTGKVEGILVRGASDFNIVGSCFESNVLANSPGGEEVTKVSAFYNFIPGPTPSVGAGMPVDSSLMSILAVTFLTAIAVFLLRKQLD